MTYQRLLQWVTIATSALCSVWFATSLLDPFNIPKLAILVVGAAALIGLLAGSVKLWWHKDAWPVTAVVGLFLAGLTAAAVASDQNIYRTLWGAWARNDGWLAYASLAVITFAVAIGFRGRDARFGVYALIAVGYVQVAYGLLQTTGNDPVNWNNGYNAILGTVGNPNFASALLGISAVAMCWIALDSEFSIFNRITHAVIALLAVWLTIRSESIQGTLAFGAGFALLLAAWLLDADRPSTVRRLTGPYVAVGALGALVAIVGLTGNGPLGGILYSQNLINRTYYWRAGWRMFREHVLFGVGLDSFGDWYRIVRLQEQVDATGATVTSNAAHSVIFQMLGTGGLALFGTYLLLQGFVVWRALVAFKASEHRMLLGAVFGAWAAFLLQSLFSIDQLGLTVWGWVLSGLVIALSLPGAVVAQPSSPKRRVNSQPEASGAIVAGGVAAALLALAAVVIVSSPLSKDAAIKLATSYTFDTNAPDANVQAAIKDAVLAAANGANDPYWRVQAVSKLYAIGAVDDGIKLAESSVQEFPRDINLWDLVATAYEQTGRSALAIPARTKTVELDPLNVEYAQMLASDKAQQ